MLARLQTFLQRTTPGSVLAVLGLVLLALALIVPLPYVVLKPGLTADTLGSKSGTDEPLITVTGTETFPTEGALRLTTVRVQGEPGRTPSMVTLQWYEGRFYLGGALLGWSDRSSAVLPLNAVYEPEKSAEQTEEENQAEMVQSQSNATAAAMRELNVEVTSVVVDRVVAGAPAEGKLQAGDVVLAVDDVPMKLAREVPAAVLRRAPGDTITVKVRRTPPGAPPQELPIAITAAASEQDPARAFLGILVGERYPFEVSIKLDDVGGPSAGLMFALGIIDKLTPGAMTNGAIIAGTGSIGADGVVGPIGGIAQKLAGARDEGATVFLVPEANCPQASRNAPDGLRLVKVTALADAVTSLERLRTGQGDIPGC